MSAPDSILFPPAEGPDCNDADPGSAELWATSPWTPREWQREALPVTIAALERAPVVRAVMGAGKSVFIAELVHHLDVKTVVVTPSQNLVRQLAETLRDRGLDVGQYFADRKQPGRKVVVCCNDSLPGLARKIGPPELLVMDEAHKSECRTVKDVVFGTRDPLTGERAGDGWMPKWRVGMTATPYRSDSAETLSLFETLVYDYGLDDAIRDGVIVPPKLVHYTGKLDANEACVELISKAEGPGVVDAISINDAKEHALQLRNAGVRCKTVHSRLHRSTVDARLKALEAGELDCIVHVNMLSEGVDFPWLRWLCCRRPISSPVLFAQYVGRGLRSLDVEKFPEQIERWGPKKHCTIFDVHGLFGTHGLECDAAIGMTDDEDPVVDPLDLDFLIEETKREPEGQTLNGVPVKFITPAESYVVRLRLEFQCRGLLSLKLPDLSWRDEPMTDQQANKLRRLEYVPAADDIPAQHRRSLRVAWKMADAMTLKRGTASDLISILDVLRAYNWPGTDVEAAQESA